MGLVRLNTGNTGNTIDESGIAVPVGEASFPVPFQAGLEFNAPVHGTWNIVHVGMLVPESHQIYVCADNCMRGVVLTAAEMGAADRFSCVLLEEEDLYENNLENVTIEGVTDAIRRLSRRPRAVMVFLVCLHHFTGTDVGYVFGELEARFPDIDFMRCWMDPVMQKTGLTPEQKLKEAMFRPIRPLPVEPGLICVLGDNRPLDPDSELFRLLSGARTDERTESRACDGTGRGAESLISGGTVIGPEGLISGGIGIGAESRTCEGTDSRAEDRNDCRMQWTGTSRHVLQLHDCRTYEDYLRIGAASLFITRSPSGFHGVTQLARRLGRPFLYLPPSCGEREIPAELEKAAAEIRRAEKTGAGEADTEIRQTAAAGAEKADAEICQTAGFAGAENVEAAIRQAEARGYKDKNAPVREMEMELQEAADRALAHALSVIGDTEITLDYIATPRPLSLARCLLEHGFRLTRVYLDAMAPEEKPDFIWLQENHPQLLLNATIHPGMRVLHAQDGQGGMLAIGPKAAWFGGTRHFVNMVEYNGMWGFSGLIRLAGLLEDAFYHEKDTREIVPRKGLGCTCVLQSAYL